jgi:Serine-pyruvate aminotransferase/archaeal aspartate aminotransferase
MNRISVLSFDIHPIEERDSPLSVIPVVDGIPLTRIAEDFERERGFEPAGGYGGLLPDVFRYGPLDAYFLGQTDQENFDRGDYYLLGCSCGEVGCWPLTARISRTATSFIWDKFRQPFRPERDYSNFGPLTFELNQYLVTVKELALKFPSS